MDKEIQDLKIEVASFTAKVGSWMDTTTEYRKSLCDKITFINNKLNDLPCRERKGIYENIRIQAALLWVAVGTVFGIVLKHILGV